MAEEVQVQISLYTSSDSVFKHARHARQKRLDCLSQDMYKGRTVTRHIVWSTDWGVSTSHTVIHRDTAQIARNETHRSYRDFWRTTRLPGVLPGVPTSLDRFLRFPKGVAYGGGRRDRAASQSNGCDADREGEVTGEMG